MQSNVTLLKAPLSGYIWPLDAVPDPVFANKVLGDGIAIDPTSNMLLAPCDGEIIQIHRANHAITLRSSSGLEILMHIGIDTVSLKGEGFSVKVMVGEKVYCGQELIAFDADYVALHARSLLTLLVITNIEKVSQLEAACGTITPTSEPLLTLTCDISDAEKAHNIQTAQTTITSHNIPILNHFGLHARPAANLAHLAKSFDAEIRLVSQHSTVDAKSVVAIMGLNIQFGHNIAFAVTGGDAQHIIATLKEAVRSGLGEDINYNHSITQARALNDEPPLLLQPASCQGIFSGTGASPGIVVGEIFQFQHQKPEFEQYAVDIKQELHDFKQAVASSKKELKQLVTELKLTSPEQADIFKAHFELIDDPTLLKLAYQLISEGLSASFSWEHAIENQKRILQQLKNPLLAARAIDISDVGNRVQQKLSGKTVSEAVLPHNAILIAEELTPSDTINLDLTKVVGFCTTTGGISSHVAIIARSMSLPAIVGIHSAALELTNGTQVILNGQTGELDTQITEQKLERTHHYLQNQQAIKSAAQVRKYEAAITLDLQQIKIAANIGSLNEAQSAIKEGADSIGLLRSEFLYLDRLSEPTEQEQHTIYQSISQSLSPDQSLTIRTLDVGGDKPLPYLHLPEEDNPFLGERGIRISLNKPALLRRQLRAILSSTPTAQLKILFPMVANVVELLAAKQVIHEEANKLGLPLPKVGIMIEVPSSALIADKFAPHVDFFSIGTNDLAQYTLAMDRGHPLLAANIDALHPGVLKLIAMTAHEAKRYNKTVSICGCIASDPVAIPILIGLGINELSVAVPILAQIKAQIRLLELKQCQYIASQALQLENPAQVRQLSSQSATPQGAPS